MSEQISPAAADRIRSLCNKVAVAHHLDAEIHRELCAHMEDELLAYTTGRQRPTEEDALILVERHFGDPAVIRSLFRTVHHQAAAFSLFRRLLGIAVVTAVGSLLTALLACATGYLAGPRPMGITLWLIAPTLAPLYLWAAALWWTSRYRSTSAPWFDRLPAILLICLAIGAYLLAQSLLWYAVNHWMSPTSDLGITATKWFGAMMMAWGILLASVTAAAWAWWCDYPGIARKRLLLAAAAWTLWHLLLSVLWPATLLLTGQIDAAFAPALLGAATLSIFRATLALLLGLALYKLLTRHRRPTPAT